MNLVPHSVIIGVVPVTVEWYQVDKPLFIPPGIA